MRIIEPRIEKAAGGEFIAYMSDNTKYRIETNGVWYRLTPRATRADRLAKKKANKAWRKEYKCEFTEGKLIFDGVVKGTVV